jgi:hypothetical protein
VARNRLARVPVFRRVTIAAALVVAVALSGCATYRGVTEFSAYRDTYAEASAIGNDILDRMAVAERELFAAARPFDPKFTAFEPDLARYYVVAVDPPATAAFRRTVDAVIRYNDALYGFASGEDARALATRLSRLGAVGAGAAADLAVLGRFEATGAGAASVAAAKAVNTALSGLEPLTGELIGFAYRARFRERLLEQAPTIRDAIAQTRAATPKVYDALRFAVVTQVDADPNRLGQLTEAEIDRIRRANTLVATWVILLDASREALDIAVAAVKRDGGEGSFDGVLLASERLAEAVGAARRNLAGGG